MGLLDPIGYLSEILLEAYLWMVRIFQQLYATPMTLGGTDYVAYLYGNALGVAEYLSMGVTFVLLTLAFFIKRARVSLAHAVLVLLAVAIFSPFWFAGLDEVERTGDLLTATMLAITTIGGGSTSPMINLPSSLDLGNAAMTMFMFWPTAGFGITLASVFVAYEGMIVFVKFAGLLSFSLMAFGERSRKVFSFLMSLGIVCMVLGRPVAVTIINVIQGIALSIPNVSPAFVTTVAVIAGFFTALIAQPILLFLTYRSVSGVVGRVAASVTGKVNALMEDRSKSFVQSINNSHAAVLSGRTTAVRHASVTTKIRRGLHKAGHNAVVAKTAAMLAAKAAASTTGPVGKAAYLVGATAVRTLRKPDVTHVKVVD